MIKDENLKEEVEMWASCRFQLFARTARGIMHHQQVIEVFKKYIPGFSGGFEYIASFQVFGKMSDSDFRKISAKRLMRMYPEMRVAYVKEDTDGNYYSILAKGLDDHNEPIILYKIKLPGNPIICLGKTENQNHAIKFARGRFLQNIDMNQDFYIEEAFKVFNILGEFLRNPKLVLLGFQEDIFTENFGRVAWMSAHADRSFNFVQSELNWLGVRENYGHPDIWLTGFALTKSGISKDYFVNEDAPAGKEVMLSDGQIDYTLKMMAGKAREVALPNTAGLWSKFGAGGVEQAMGESFLELFKMRSGESNTYTFLRAHSHWTGGIGFILRKNISKLGLFLYLAVVFFSGVSGFAAFPSDVFFGLTGLVLFSQAIVLVGVIRMIFDYGLK